MKSKKCYGPIAKQFRYISTMMHAGFTPLSQIGCNRLENAVSPNSGSTLTERTTRLMMLRVAWAPKTSCSLRGGYEDNPSFDIPTIAGRISTRVSPKPYSLKIKKLGKRLPSQLSRQPRSHRKPSQTPRILFKLVQSKTWCCCMLALSKNLIRKNTRKADNCRWSKDKFCRKRVPSSWRPRVKGSRTRNYKTRAERSF